MAPPGARRPRDSVSQRAVVPGRRKAVLLVHALARGAVVRPRPGPSPAPLDAVRHLVDAAAPGEPAPARQRPMASLERVVWVIDLFEQQAHRRQQAHRQQQQARRSSGIRLSS